MAVIDLAIVIGYLIEKTFDGVIGSAQRKELVVKTLKKLKIDPDNPPKDYDGVYVYALVEYGVGKPKELLELFRKSVVREAFRRVFEYNDRSVFNHEVSEYVKSEEGKLIYTLDYDPLQELTKFQEVFIFIVNRVRTVVEVRQDLKLDNIQDKIEALLIHINASQEQVNKIVREKHQISAQKPTLSGPLIVDVSRVIDFPVYTLETVFGEPTEVSWRKIGSAEDIPDGGETREYKFGKYTLDVNYDKSGVAKGVHFYEGLAEYNYNLDDWNSILDRFGVTMVRLPDLQGITTRIWSSYVGYFIKVATRKVGGHVEAVRIYKIPR
jgi:hypothetical protein